MTEEKNKEEIKQEDQTGKSECVVEEDCGRQPEEVESEKNEAEKSKTEDSDAKESEAEKPAAESASDTKEDEDLKTQFLRLSADFQNYRRRVETEKSDIYAYANEKIILQLLEVMDNFDRAMQAAPEGDQFAEGMKLILKQLGDVLDKNNVKEIEADGKDFNPTYHNAVMTEASEELASGTITKVFQKGYMINTKVIRPSMVAVAQ